MTAPQAVQLILGIAEIVLRLLPAREQPAAKRALAQAFIAGKLADLDEYARSRGKKR